MLSGGHEALSIVPRLPAWSFLRHICIPLFGTTHCLPLYRAGDLRLPPLIRREKDGGLPPVTPDTTS